MDQTKPANQNSRTKTLLAIGLAVVLVVVLATQYWPAGESPEETPLSVVRPAAPPTVVSTPADPVPVPKPAQERDLEQHPLPEVSVASVLMSNPFVPLGADPASPPVAFQGGKWNPQGIGQEPPSPEAQALSELNEQVADLQAIVHGRNAGVMIDGRFVQEQDLLNDHWRVVSIRADSIVVEPVKPGEQR